MKPIDAATKIEELWNSVAQLQMKVREEVLKLQRQCEHEWTYHSDPSGNNDSGFSCMCGAWSRKRPD
jgi:hypothetical protein